VKIGAAVRESKSPKVIRERMLDPIRLARMVKKSLG